VLVWACNNHKLHFIVGLIANLITAFLGKPNGFLDSNTAYTHGSKSKSHLLFFLARSSAKTVW